MYEIFRSTGVSSMKITDAKALRAIWYSKDHVKHWNVPVIGNKIVETLTFSTPSIDFNIISFALIKLTSSTSPPQKKKTKKTKTMLNCDSMNFLATYGQH